MLQKLTKFLKENLVAVVGIAAIVISCLLMLLPGQFVNLFAGHGNQDKDIYTMNGYQFFFNSITSNGTEYNHGVGIVPAGIAIIVLFVLALASFILYKKSSALLMLGGVLVLVASILFFSMEASAEKFYPNFVWGSETTRIGVIQWVSYVNGALLLLASAFAIYKAVLMMRDEIKHPTVKKDNTYNYLKK